MQQSRLGKVLNFVRRTGDKVILFEGESEFVIMNLDDYEKVMKGGEDIRDMSEDELMKKINREIALWRESQAEDDREFQAEQLNKPYYDKLDDFGDKEEDVFDFKESTDNKYGDEKGKREFDNFEIDEFDEDSEDFEFVDNYLDDVEEEEIDEDEGPVNVNNFGYQNPSDTSRNNNPFSPRLGKNDINKDEEEGWNKNYSNIPPPPDVTGARDEVPF